MGAGPCMRKRYNGLRRRGSWLRCRYIALRQEYDPLRSRYQALRKGYHVLCSRYQGVRRAYKGLRHASHALSLQYHRRNLVVMFLQAIAVHTNWSKNQLPRYREKLLLIGNGYKTSMSGKRLAISGSPIRING
ncbi:hypothetical protein [Carboxylicivirga taeanensis]|uniref:hypothetical protein n=1 Tax=Carboxylicivirga taeanensis TaxID=1416875 RepID=UPI003F6E338E